MAGKQKQNSIVRGNTVAEQTIPKDGLAITLPKWVPYAIVAFTALVYSQAFTNGITSFDDDFYIVNNPFLRDFSWHGVVAIFTSFYSGNYHPLTSLVHLFQYHFFELNPLAYHTTNIILHLVNTYIVFIIAKRLSGQDITAMLVSLLFGIHPLHVESVAWISELKDVLYAHCYLLAINQYLLYLDSGLKRKHLFMVMGYFLLACLSKSAAVTLPVLLLAFDFYRGRKLSAGSILEKTPMLLLSLLFGILAILSQRAGGAYNGLMISYGAVNSFFLFTTSLSFYIIKLLAPTGLQIIHNFPILQGIYLPWLYYASLPFVLLVIWLVSRKNKLSKEILFGAAFFLISISVMLQVVSVGSALTAERYTYMSYIGLFYILGQFISLVAVRYYKGITIAIVSIFVIACSAISFDRITVWKDDATLFNDFVEKNPDFYYGYWLRGNVAKKNGELKKALQDYTMSIQLNHTFEDAFFNRGRIYQDMGDSKSAIADYSESIRLNPKQADSYNNRGWQLFTTGNVKAAMSDFNKSLELKPDFADALNNRGWVNEQSGDTQAAMRDYTQAINKNPGYERAVYNRAALKIKTKDFIGSVQDYTQLLKTYPDDGRLYFSRAMALQGANNLAAACNDWKQAKALGHPKADEMIGQYCK